MKQSKEVTFKKYKEAIQVLHSVLSFESTRKQFKGQRFMREQKTSNDFIPLMVQAGHVKRTGKGQSTNWSWIGDKPEHDTAVLFIRGMREHNKLKNKQYKENLLKKTVKLSELAMSNGQTRMDVDIIESPIPVATSIDYLDKLEDEIKSLTAFLKNAAEKNKRLEKDLNKSEADVSILQQDLTAHDDVMSDCQTNIRHLVAEDERLRVEVQELRDNQTRDPEDEKTIERLQKRLNEQADELHQQDVHRHEVHKFHSEAETRLQNEIHLKGKKILELHNQMNSIKTKTSNVSYLWGAYKRTYS